MCQGQWDQYRWLVGPELYLEHQQSVRPLQRPGDLDRPVERLRVEPAYLFAEKTTDTKGCGWDFGWRADVMFGTDYRFNTESGLETHLQFQIRESARNDFYGTAFTQFYMEVAKMTWKSRSATGMPR